MKVNSIYNFYGNSFTYKPSAIMQSFNGNQDKEDTINIDKRKLQQERAKLLRHLQNYIWQDNYEAFEQSILTRSNDISLRMMKSLYGHYCCHMQNCQNNPENIAIGELIYGRIIEMETGKAQNNDNYANIKSNIKYDKDKVYLKNIFKNAIENRDTILLRVAIEASINNYQPYADTLFDAIDELFKRNN